MNKKKLFFLITCFTACIFLGFAEDKLIEKYDTPFYFTAYKRKLTNIEVYDITVICHIVEWGKPQLVNFLIAPRCSEEQLKQFMRKVRLAMYDGGLTDTHVDFYTTFYQYITLLGYPEWSDEVTFELSDIKEYEDHTTYSYVLY